MIDMFERIFVDIFLFGVVVGMLIVIVVEELGLTINVIVVSGLIDVYVGGVVLVGVYLSGMLVLISGMSNCYMLCSEKEIFIFGVWGLYWSVMLLNYWLIEGG